jgi:hypothetical protein
MPQLVLTDSGYVAITPYIVGVKVKAFDQDTGEVIWNTVESVRWVDAAEWVRFHENADLPPFRFFRINNTWTLNSEQSIWRNGTNVCHAKHLIVGDEIYDDDNNPVTITSIEEVTADGWWRFDISGDHSYIVDGLMLHNASRFWVGGTGTWDLSATTHWASSTGGASGQSAPGSADTVTFDGSSGGGTVTPSYGGTGTFTSITCGAFTGTIAWNTNNNSVTLSSVFSCSASGTRTISLGNGTWTLTNTSGTVWDTGTTTGLTFNANSSVLVFTSSNALGRTFNTGTLTFSTVTVSANSGRGSFVFTGSGTAATIGTLNVTAPSAIFVSSTGLIITNALTISGTSSSVVIISCSSATSGTGSISSANNGTFSWCAFRNMAFSGGGTFTANNSQDLGGNSGITINTPSTFDKALFSQPGLTY